MALFTWIRAAWRRGWLPGAVVLLLLLIVAVLQLDSALGRIEAPGYPAATLGSQFRIDTLSGDVRNDRRTAWCVWTQDIPNAEDAATARAANGDPGPFDRVSECVKAFENASAHDHIKAGPFGAKARLLMRTYVVLDLCLVALYTFLFVRVMSYLRRIPPSVADANVSTATALERATARPWLWVLVALLVGSELVEDACQFALSLKSLTPYRIDLLNDIAGFAAIVKWAAVFLAVLLLAMLTVHSRVCRGWYRWKDVVPVRLQLAVTAVLLILLTGAGTDQVQDALLGLLDHCGTAVWTPVAVLVFSLLLWRSVHRTVLTDDEGRPPVRQLTILVLAFALACLGLLLGASWHRLWAPAALLGLVFVLSLLAGARLRRPSGGEPGLTAARADADDRAGIPEGERRDALRRTARRVAALPFVVLGVFAVRAAVATAVVGPRRSAAIALIVVGAGSVVLGIAMPSILNGFEGGNQGWAQPPDAGNGRSGLYFLLAGGCAVFAVVCLSTLTWGRSGFLPSHVGPLAVVTLFLSLALVVLNEMQRWAELNTPVAGFRALGLSRTPAFTLLLAWFVLAAVLDTTGNHDVRVRESRAPLAPSRELAGQFEKWLAANCANAPQAGRLPLVVVAASGGGIRAAYWTSGVLDKLFPPTPVEPPKGSGCARTDGRAPVFAVSGISGGSLGAVSWLSRPRKADPHSHERVFGTDHLSGALAWMTFVDLPRSFIGFPGKDRAAVMEESWERSQGELAGSFYATWQQPGTAWTPLALLNGTAVESGCRVLTAPVQLGAFDRPIGPTSCTRRPEETSSSDLSPGERNDGGPTLIDVRGGFLCAPQEINRSTAAMLSARFPYITPSGRLTAGKCGTDASMSVVDGGYVEGTGSLTAIDLHQELKELVDCGNAMVYHQRKPAACPLSAPPAHKVRLVFVQIDNGYNSVAATAAPGRPHELSVPVQSLRQAAATKDANARQRVYEAFGCRNYLRFANVRGPGAQAPLGWVMSLTARADLDRQLKTVADSGGGAHTLAGRLRAADARCPEGD
ncbi:hypothetical protein C8250_006985 [Streptomyces sp. So13.3]|uniref:hypothetical protein n=1 Tax=Streptomyces TaxID=1883 RepID=UPI00110711D4|nr:MULTISPECIES: hypothetical protein [Streptomyces]MCZ4097937.1 hypothetical protein [Streptomyces sp. H39-C1]QNA71684.1 hypothetical protein C8250_006985 [Streptomyces sp. So13.3]